MWRLNKLLFTDSRYTSIYSEVIKNYGTLILMYLLDLKNTISS